MLVQDIMQPDVMAISPKTTVPKILSLLQRRGVRHLPVVDGAELVGIVSDRDLKGAMLSAASARAGDELASLLDRLTAAQIMTPTVTTIGLMSPVEEAARLMVTKKISSVPVTEQGRLVGIVTETDALQFLVKAMGAAEPSSRLDVVLKDEPAALTDVMTTIEASGMRISSMMTLAGLSGRREVAIRVTPINADPAIKALEAKGYIVRDSWRG